MKKKMLWAAMAMSLGHSFYAFGALDVVERAGGFSVVRDGKTIVESISLDGCDVADGDAKTSFTTKDGSRVWNRWCEDPARAIRLEVAARADGAVEITMAGQVPWDAKNRRRAMRIDISDDVFAGKRYNSIKKLTTRQDMESGVFDVSFGGIESRFLAVDGLTFDFNAYGPGDENAINSDGWRHVDSMHGSYRISRRNGGGWKMEVGGDTLTPWGGYTATKLVLREGEFADYDRIHAVRAFSYNYNFETLRLVSFGAPVTGRDYVDGETTYRSTRGFGWLQWGWNKRFAVVGHPSGAYYSAMTGKEDSTYRFGTLPDGHYFFTFAAGNYLGRDNRFSVEVNGKAIMSDESVSKRSVRKITIPLHVKGGNIDVKFSGNWMVSAMGVQPIIYDSEDFSISRDNWFVDGFEPGFLHRNCDTAAAPYSPARRDETLPLPVPGEEFSAEPRMPPAETELPDPDLPSLAWTKNADIYRLYDNSSTLANLDAPGALDTYLDREISGRRVTAIMLSGMLSRHTFLNQIDRCLDSVKNVVEVSHRRGIKVIDHWDATLLWNIGEGFRVMAERTPELLMSMHGDVPSYQLCIMNPEFRKKLFDYARRDVANGVDALQIDEVVFWHHGCVCKYCREAFHRDTGWWMPMDETSPAWHDGSPFMKRWKNWRIRQSTDFMIALRRALKDIKPDLVLSAYTTPTGMFSTYDSLGNGRDIMDLPRAVNFFGIEVMTRSILKSLRAELPQHRTTRSITFRYGTPVWNWYYNADWQNDYASWALSTMTGQTPFLSEVDKDDSVPDYPRFSSGMVRDGAEPVAEIALLFSPQSRNWNSGTSMRADLLGTAQALEALHIPYEIISEVSLDAKSLSKFKVLFVGAAHCLTDSQVAAVREFAENGGTVRLSTLAGTCDEIGERRAKWPFADVFGFEPRIDKNSNVLFERKCGKGKMIYSPAPRGEPFCVGSLNVGRTYDYAADPAAEAEFRAEVESWAGAHSWWQVSAPDKVYTSVWREKSGAIAIHFLNTTGVNNKTGEVVTNKSPVPAFPQLKDDIVFAIPASGAVRATATSPEFAGERELKVERVFDSKVCVTVPKDIFRTYLFVRCATR